MKNLLYVAIGFTLSVGSLVYAQDEDENEYLRLKQTLKAPYLKGAVKLSSDGKVMVAYERYEGDKAGTLDVWNVETGKKLFRVGSTREVSFVPTWAEPSTRVESANISPDSKFVFAVLDDLKRPYKRVISVWEIATGKRVAQMEADIHGSIRDPFQFSPDGKLLVVAIDNQLTVFDYEHFTKQKSLKIVHRGTLGVDFLGGLGGLPLDSPTKIDAINSRARQGFTFTAPWYVFSKDSKRIYIVDDTGYADESWIDSLTYEFRPSGQLRKIDETRRHLLNRSRGIDFLGVENGALRAFYGENLVSFPLVRNEQQKDFAFIESLPRHPGYYGNMDDISGDLSIAVDLDREQLRLFKRNEDSYVEIDEFDLGSYVHRGSAYRRADLYENSRSIVVYDQEKVYVFELKKTP